MLGIIHESLIDAASFTKLHSLLGRLVKDVDALLQATGTGPSQDFDLLILRDIYHREGSLGIDSGDSSICTPYVLHGWNWHVLEAPRDSLDLLVRPLVTLLFLGHEASCRKLIPLRCSDSFRYRFWVRLVLSCCTRVTLS